MNGKKREDKGKMRSDKHSMGKRKSDTGMTSSRTNQSCMEKSGSHDGRQKHVMGWGILEERNGQNVRRETRS